MTELNKVLKKNQWGFIAIGFWLIVWTVVSRKVAMEAILPSPWAVIKTLGEIVKVKGFWMTIFLSSGRIILGFCLALFLGLIMAIFSYISYGFKALISPIIKVIKVTPVASFIILALLWIKGKNLSILISFLMVLPMTYTNVLQGLEDASKELLEMAKVFRLSMVKKIKAIYLPGIMPHLISAISVGLGFCWKAGIAAEVIGIPKNSIGLKLYEAKIHLMTKELMAWTIVIIIISIVFENIVLKVINHIENHRG